MFCKARSAVFHQGHPVLGTYFIYSGKVKEISVGISGRTQVIRLATEGDVLGHRGFLSGNNYTVSALALEDTHLCFIQKAQFLDLLELDNKLAVEMARFFAGELDIADKKLQKMASQTNIQKIADALIMIYESFGFEDDGKTLGFSLSRREIGEIAGTVPDVVSRILSRLAELKMIFINGKKIKIPDLDLLRNFAHTLS